jgi:hypothetical protein
LLLGLLSTLVQYVILHACYEQILNRCAVGAFRLELGVILDSEWLFGLVDEMSKIGLAVLSIGMGIQQFQSLSFLFELSDLHLLFAEVLLLGLYCLLLLTLHAYTFE